MSDGSHELDKVLLVQPVKQDGEERESEGEGSREVAKQHEDKKGDDGVKIVLTGPSVQAEEDDISEIVRLDQDKDTIPVPELLTEDEAKKDESGGERKSETKNEGIKLKEGEENCLDEPEVVTVQDASSIPVPNSVMEMQTPPENRDVESTSSKDKQDSLDSQGVKEPSSQKDKVMNYSKPAQPQEHKPDSTAMASHPLKPLPNIDEGITETKSEPRLPLLPPIGTTKVGTPQNNDSPLMSQSATGIISNTTAKEVLALKHPTDGQKEGESASLPLSDTANVKKRKSTDTLRSTSGSSISKSKKSSTSNSAVSLGQKSKSRESLKAGHQNRLSATSKSSDNLVDGTTKKLSISRESLKAASQVYSNAPPAKSGESHKKGDSGRTSASKSKGASKDKEGRNSEQKDTERSGECKDKDEKVCEQMKPIKNEEGVNFSGSTKEEANSKDTKDCNLTKESVATNIDLHTDTKEKPMLHLPSTGNQPVKLNDALGETEHSEGTTADSCQGTSSKEVNPSDDATPPNSEENKGTEADKNLEDHAEESNVEKSEDPKEQEKVEPCDTSSVTNKEEEDNEETSPLPLKPVVEESSEKQESANNVAPPSSSDQQRVEADPKAKDDEKTRQLGEHKVDLISDVQPRGTKEVPTSPTPGEDTVSQTSASDCISKLEIDKKTGQSEQSIVEAVEKAAETSPMVQVITTSA